MANWLTSFGLKYRQKFLLDTKTAINFNKEITRNSNEFCSTNEVYKNLIKFSFKPTKDLLKTCMKLDYIRVSFY